MNFVKRIFVSQAFICIVYLLRGYHATKDVTTTEFQVEALNKVNYLRRAHLVPELELNQELKNHAVTWCNKLLVKAEKDHKLKAYFSHPEKEGEAVFVFHISKSIEEVTATRAVLFWYCEGINHNFSNNIFTPKTAQFTQLIWKDTRQMGVAKVFDVSSGNVAIVAHFFPNGNFVYIKSFKENVFLPISQSVSSLCLGETVEDDIVDDAIETSTENGPPDYLEGIQRRSFPQFQITTTEPQTTTTETPTTTTEKPTTTTEKLTTTTQKPTIKTTERPKTTTTRPPRPYHDPLGLATKDIEDDDEVSPKKLYRKHGDSPYARKADTH